MFLYQNRDAIVGYNSRTRIQTFDSGRVDYTWSIKECEGLDGVEMIGKTDPGFPDSLREQYSSLYNSLRDSTGSFKLCRGGMFTVWVQSDQINEYVFIGHHLYWQPPPQHNAIKSSTRHAYKDTVLGNGIIYRLELNDYTD